MRKIELLAPAGSWEALEAAVKAGADAVYLAGSQFGARKSAQNFNDEALIEAVRYCHLRGVKVYLTVNTLLGDEELTGLEAFLTPLYKAGIDAFIVQDFGVFAHLRRLYPEIELHCSTQMALSSSEDVKAMKTLGATRVVLPREMHVSEIEAISGAVDIELEAFVHGALCVSVSGQCLMSSMIGGRSGNRGSCAQSCRQKYRLVKTANEERITSKDGNFLLSPRDLMTIDKINDLVKAGVTSLKIEGRMKGPEYAYAVVRAYRAAIDALAGEAQATGEAGLESLKDEMHRVFNRDFTEGFVLGTTNKGYISQSTPGNRGVLIGEVLSYDKRQGQLRLMLSQAIRKGDDLQVRLQDQALGGRVEYLLINGQRVESAAAQTEVIVNFKHEVARGTQVYRTYDQALMKALQLAINDAERTTAVSMRLTLRSGEPLKLSLRHESGVEVAVVSEQVAEQAQKTPLSRERIQEQMEKLGGTPFRLCGLEIDQAGGETTPIKALNQLRRDGVEALTEALNAKDQRAVVGVSDAAAGFAIAETDRKLQMTAMVRTPEQYRAAAELGIKQVYVHNIFEALELSESGTVVLETDAWLSGWAFLQQSYPETEMIPYLGQFDSVSTEERLEQLARAGIAVKTLLVSGMGQLELARSKGYSAVADSSLNAFNQNTCRFLNDRGASTVTLSLELNEDQLAQMSEAGLMAKVATEIIGYGSIPVMKSKYCPINGVYSKDKAGCQICRRDQYYLEDKTGARFLVKGDAHCQVEIFNSAVLNLADEWPRLEALGIASYRLNFVDETPRQVTDVIETHLKSALGFPIELRGRGYTKGHFKRGVL